MASHSDVQGYYELSDNELARRYIKDLPFLSREYCEAALRHRFELYPYIPEFADFGAWRGKRVRPRLSVCSALTASHFPGRHRRRK